MAGTAIADITAETLATIQAVKSEVAKAQTTGYLTTTGLTGYELEAPAKSLFPVLSPFRNRIPRVKAPIGALNANWKAITKVNATNVNPFVGFGFAGNRIDTVEQDYMAAYKVMALDDVVQLDAQALARGFDDLRARSGTNLLYALMIAEDKMLLGGSNVALPAVGTVTVTQSDTGGAIAASTQVNVVARARTLEGYFFNTAAADLGGTATSANAQVTTSAAAPATHSVAASVPAVQGAVLYDWYVGASNTAYFYFGSTTVNKVTVTSIPVADAVNPSNPDGTALPGAAVAAVGAGTNVRTVLTNTSADTNSFNGLMTSITQDYNGANGQATAGTQTASGAYIKSLDGATLTGNQGGGITEIDNALQNLWDTARVSPTAILMSAQHHRDITRKIINSFGSTTLFGVNNLEERQGAVAGVYMRTYINPAVNGQPVQLITMPHLPNGVLIGISEVLPYPSSNVESVFEVETQQEYMQLEYPPARIANSNVGGPRYDLEVRAIETFKNYFPAGCFVLENVAVG